jgi:ribonuclease Z
VPLHQPQVSIHFLGTGGSWPSADRNVAATAIKRGGDILLFDCGEGTQRQFQKSGLSYMAVQRVFISHLHGDHFFGLPGLFKTMQLNERTAPLEVYGPRGLDDVMSIYGRIASVKGQYDITWHELEEGDVVPGDGYAIHCKRMNHGALDLAYAYVEDGRPGRFDKTTALRLGVPEGPMFRRLQMGEAVQSKTGARVEPKDVLGPARPGRRIVITGDTGPCEALVEFAGSADFLISEATYCSDMVAKAQEYGHMTAAWAAETARRAKVRELVLTHVSPRYTNADQHLAEAKPIFANTRVAKDFLAIEVPFVD